MGTVRTFARERDEERASRGACDGVREHQPGVRVDAAVGVASSLADLGRASSCWLRRVLVVRGDLSVGALLAFLGYVGGMFRRYSSASTCTPPCARPGRVGAGVRGARRGGRGARRARRETGARAARPRALRERALRLRRRARRDRRRGRRDRAGPDGGDRRPVGQREEHAPAPAAAAVRAAARPRAARRPRPARVQSRACAASSRRAAGRRAFNAGRREHRYVRPGATRDTAGRGARANAHASPALPAATTTSSARGAAR